MTEWQPIETAPKDGTRILLYDDGWFCIGGYWDNEDRDSGGQCWKDSQSDGLRFPTHWMPLPEPPK